ncbi:hypothetical protein KFK09_020484 [Dendrobium nobile]|uniref:Uncharacterized protein n=1 Tax=Dendrobium nobile TaxID=94219 RepID=A0A8T3AMP1_DENNO|nr:hypothetical protein KFK09_020484 [Dendrobium nobile]
MKALEFLRVGEMSTHKNGRRGLCFVVVFNDLIQHIFPLEHEGTIQHRCRLRIGFKQDFGYDSGFRVMETGCKGNSAKEL